MHNAAYLHAALVGEDEGQRAALLVQGAELQVKVLYKAQRLELLLRLRAVGGRKVRLGPLAPGWVGCGSSVVRRGCGGQRSCFPASKVSQSLPALCSASPPPQPGPARPA